MGAVVDRVLSPRARGGGFLPRIEALRGIAALLVVAMHAMQLQWQPGMAVIGAGTPDPWLDGEVRVLRILANGSAAVVLFFAISGFVLSLSLERGPGPILPAAWRFAIARVFRIYPAAIATVGVFVLLAAVGVIGPVTWDVVLRDAALLDYRLNGVMWSLQIEMFAAPFIFAAFLLGRRWGPLPVLAVAVTFAGLAFAKQWSGLLDRAIASLNSFHAFFFGMLVPWSAPLVAWLGRRGAASVAGLAILVFVVVRPVVGLTSTFSVVIEGVTSAVLVAMIAYRPDLPGARMLDFGLVRFYGRISYSLYLLHPAVIILMSLVTGAVGAGVVAGVPTLVLILAVIPAAIAASTPFAALSYRWIERPGIALGRRLLPQPRPAAMVAPRATYETVG